MKNHAKYSLLYVEDEAYVRKAVISFLENQFTKIYEAEDGKEALEIYHDKKPDIIITDIEMPKMDGLEFCKRVRKEDEKTPIIIMTAYSHTEYLLKATELNLVKYLIKPIEEESLFGALKSCFEKIESESPSVVELGEDYIYDTFNHVLTHKKEIIKLTSSQTLLLDILIKNRGHTVSYIQLENSIWYDSGMSKDALRCLVRDIRKFTYKGIIENISKVGYKANLNG
jgi:DNA-binding response OmpR family regulator